ncbi:ankyrin [Aspergillus neoniger CBS 115656]|uniref:Ankyrin n=1 Tax=Aspergillus neoniger (strain CBS 115656) TaxID=1448310 RepID=A0A318Z9X2_ASPNB|nr:ankyrin [Aspergillus neoniger CBS 115656]PYH33302.1 ankyrin [Aspergillus neoniger CBS 115656]
MADTIWESYRPELERLYIHEGRKLSEVREYMRTKYGFDERKSQYEKYFKRWGLRKNHSLTSAEGKFIGRRIDKRKREHQKESEVNVDGVQYPPSKLKKSRYNKNKTFVSTVDNLPNAPSPSTPQGIVVCTPATPGMRLIWNQSLPWFQFAKLLKPGQDPNLSSLPSALAVTSPQSPDLDKLGKGEGRRTALQHAMNNGNMDLINLLLDHGANVNSAPSEEGGATALQIAAIQGYLGIARKLIDLDADINAAPAQFKGRTALEGAAEHGRIDMLRLLLDEGASLVGNYGERQYRRAVELAEKNGHMAAAKLLKSFKDKVEESGI